MVDMEFERNPRYLPQQTNDSLKGVVTPMNQKLGIYGKSNIKIDDIVGNEVLINEFEKNTLPVMNKMTDGDIFFKPTMKVLQNSFCTYLKWFSLSETFQISHDHDYEFARLNKNGYLMRISIPRVSKVIMSFQVDYIIKVDQFTPIAISQNMQSGETEGKLEEKLRMPYFFIEDFPQINALIQEPENFINTYLRDIQEDIDE